MRGWSTPGLAAARGGRTRRVRGAGEGRRQVEKGGGLEGQEKGRGLEGQEKGGGRAGTEEGWRFRRASEGRRGGRREARGGHEAGCPLAGGESLSWLMLQVFLKSRRVRSAVAAGRQPRMALRVYNKPTWHLPQTSGRRALATTFCRSTAMCCSSTTHTPSSSPRYSGAAHQGAVRRVGCMGPLCIGLDA